MVTIVEDFLPPMEFAHIQQITRPRRGGRDIYGQLKDKPFLDPLIAAVRARFPVVADRSTILPVLAIVGASFLVLGAYAARRAERGGVALLLLATMLGAFCAQTMNSQSFQRYFDTPILAMLAWLAAMAQPTGERTPRAALAGPAVLAVLLLGLVFVRVWQANQV